MSARSNSRLEIKTMRSSSLWTTCSIIDEIAILLLSALTDGEIYVNERDARFTLMGRLTGNQRFAIRTGCSTCDSNREDYDYSSRAPFTFAHKTEDEERWNWHCRTHAYLLRDRFAGNYCISTDIMHMSALRAVIYKYASTVVSHRCFQIHFPFLCTSHKAQKFNFVRKNVYSKRKKKQWKQKSSVGRFTTSPPSSDGHINFVTSDYKFHMLRMLFFSREWSMRVISTISQPMKVPCRRDLWANDLRLIARYRYIRSICLSRRGSGIGFTRSYNGNEWPGASIGFAGTSETSY